MPTRRNFILAAGLLTLAPCIWAQSPNGSTSNILVLGDSLSAEYGIRRDSGWVGLVQQRLSQSNLPYTMRNASVSGDTTSAGLSRLPAALQRHQPSIVILALGSNDALRGLPLEMTQANLEKMMALSREAGAVPVLVGMRMPPNYGRSYAEAFASMYDTLAQNQQAPLIPFLLEGVATRPELFQPDQMHPTEEAQPIIADNVWTVLNTVLKRQP
ncbi:arylesterase [Mesopusillimonas faecipullorum]|uniref:arylesterase n=1 Tax=Mesopusillimonas faecipullorum TaxID=2755040 RepID=UPI001D008B58|nr:arylesterase [Mesopusillimonas faecipullorum]